MSATGKTRLFKLLRLLSEDNTSIFTYAHEDEQKGFLFEPKGNIKLAMLDRFDVLENQHEQQIIELAKEAIVLIDCKRECPFDKYEGCILNMTVDSIEVTGWFFVFEDFPTDALSILFRYSLDSSVYEKFKYAEGSPKIVKVVTEILVNSDDAIYILLETV